MSLLSRLFRPPATQQDGPMCKVPEGAAPAVAPAAAEQGRTPDPDSVLAGLGSNSEAAAALASLTGSAEYGRVTPDKQASMLDTFAATPNAATTSYLQGEAGLAAGGTDEELAAAQDKLTPDAGSVTFGGQSYTIEEGRLLDEDGKDAGSIDNLGRYQAGEASGDVYSDIHADATLKEEDETLLSLHDADPNGRLDAEGMNPEFAGRAGGMLGDLRREGMDMGVASGFRSVEAQNGLHDQGRSDPGSVVTNAKGGESWHNYGLAADMAFNEDDGGLSWDGKENWDRYGEVAEGKGLDWGGDWEGMQDRPHVEWHPGFEADQATALLDDYKAGGLEDAWKELDPAAPVGPTSARDDGTMPA